VGHFLNIAEAVLRSRGVPMNPRDIVDAAKDEGLFSDRLVGLTPAQTMKAKLSVDVRQKGQASRFVRTAPNTFFLRTLLNESSSIYNATRHVPPTAENILVLPSSALDEHGRFQGITRKWDEFVRYTARSMFVVLPRLEAEQREDFKQLLTYILVKRGANILSFRRGTFNRVEDYLRGSLCVGFGGHISVEELNLFTLNDFRQLAFDSAVRELSEELTLPSIDLQRLERGEGLKIVGLLNDDSSPTGRKHLALVLQYDVSRARSWKHPQRGEKAITKLEWLNLRDFSHKLREFEYWSQLCLTEFCRDAVEVQPSFVIKRKMPFRRPHVLCIVGGIGSGKSAATRILTTEYGYSEVNTGKVLADLIGVPPVPRTSRREFQKLAWEFISSRSGPIQVASAVAQRIANEHRLVLVDGLRQKSTLDALRERVRPLRVAILFVHTPPHIAFEFYRERSGRKLTIEEFLRLADAPVESEVKKLIVEADAVLYNWTGKMSYDETVRALMKEIRS
jgi:predicted NUDIX family phosphoesterase/dephospho-CoA kinase